jgi:uncharacterized protein (TIGR03437 family)
LCIYGTEFGPQNGASASFTNGVLPMELGGTEVFFNGMRAPIIYAVGNAPRLPQNVEVS